MEPCACGRTLARMRPLLGRRADRLEVRGVGFYPSQVEQVLLEQPGTGLAYQLVAHGGNVAVFCEARSDRGALAEQVRAALRDRLGVELPVFVEAPGTLPRSAGKATRVLHPTVV